MANDAPPMFDATVDAPPQDKPPKRGPGRPPKASGIVPPTAAEKDKRGPGRPPKPKLKDDLQQLLAMIGLGVSAVNAADGLVILEESENVATALEHAAEKNPQLRKVLEGLVKTSAYGELVMALTRVVVPIAANHNVVPPEIASVITGRPMQSPAPPETVEEVVVDVSGNGTAA